MERIYKGEVYKALTGKSSFTLDDSVTQFSGHPVTVDVSNPAEMNSALALVRQMDASYVQDKVLHEYYRPCFESVYEAHKSSNPEEFKRALQFLVDVIHME